MSVERTLRKLQAVARERVDVGPPRNHRAYRVHVRQPVFVDHQVDTAQALKADLAADPRFEHMKEREIEEAVWAFASAAHGSRDKSHVEAFLEEHAREPEHLECWFPVEGLSVPRAIELGGAKLVPAADVELPDFVAQYPPTMHAAIGAECVGTNRREMMRRARKTVEHALRVLRVGLASDMAIVDQQLRFRLGTVYWFSESAGGGGGSRAGEIIKLELPEDLLTAATLTSIATLTPEGGTKIEQAARRAVRWFEDSQLETDPLKETLFLFFALEAIFGDTSEKSKDEGLALRRAVLSHKQEGHFTHPGQIYLMYGQVRSAAVHGSDIPEVPSDVVRTFSRDVRAALGEFLEFARREGFKKHGQLLKALDDDPIRKSIKDRFLPG
jgi:hypothetical protein